MKKFYILAILATLINIGFAQDILPSVQNHEIRKVTSEVAFVTIQPNPVSDQLTVALNDNSSAKIQLFNLVGEMVYTEEINSPKTKINVSDFKKGVYLLKVIQNQRAYTTKVVVK